MIVSPYQGKSNKIYKIFNDHGSNVAKFETFWQIMAGFRPANLKFRNGFE
jgi:hypothetical protein